MNTLDNFNWKELHQNTDSILVLAKELNIWVILGSIHRLSGNNKPHNSLYLINSEGEIIDRYDKRFCTYDIRFPELYRQYRKSGTDVIFQSFYNARQKKGGIHPVIMHITAQAMAGSNYFYMSLTNSSAAESWPCYFITPDGLVKNKSAANIPGILISDIDSGDKYYDASEPYRLDAINGKLNSGECVNDSLSFNRKNIY